MLLSQFDTLQESKEYTEQKGRMISHDMIVVFLTKNQCITSLQAATDESAKGFWLAVSSGVQEFNVMSSHPVGQGNQQLLAHMVSIDAVNQSFADDCLSYANFTICPHANATEYDFKRAKGLPITQKEVTPFNGWIKITLTQDVEAHRPHLYIYVQGVKKHVGTAPELSKSGDYLVRASSNQTHHIDDLYGVM